MFASLGSMKLDLIPFDSWMNLNRTIAQWLAKSSGQELASDSVKCFLGAGRAVLEISQTVAQFYSHKRSVAIFSNGSPYAKNFLTYFYKEGYDVQLAPENVNPVEWVQTLKKDTCLVFSIADHPVTAELYDLSALSEALETQRVIHIQLSHHRHLQNFSVQKSLYQIHIQSYGPDTAVALFGEKVKAVPSSGFVSVWDSERFSQELKVVKESFCEDKNRVLAFESQLPAGYRPFFESSSTQRVYDRIIIYHPQIGGDILQQYLASRMDRKIESLGHEHSIETSHLCRWGGTVSTLDWWKPFPPLEVLRGLLILDARWAKDLDLKNHLIEASHECRVSSAN